MNNKQDATDLNFDINLQGDDNNNNQKQYLKNKADLSDSKLNKRSKQFFEMKLIMNFEVLEV